MGRWTSPDPSGLYFADPTNPQSFNLYGYVGNNPLRFTDPNGLLTCGSGGASPAGVNTVGAAVGGFFHAIGCGIQDALGAIGSALSSSGSPQSGVSSPGSGGQSGSEPNYNLSPPANAGRFPNVQAAGIAAARQALGLTSQPDGNGYKYEWGGRLLKDKDGRFTFTNPVTFNLSTHFWSSHVMVPFGYRKAGSYHTHPGIGAPGMSYGDAAWADFQHLPEFMGEEMSGKVWRYDAGSGCAQEPCGSVVSNPNP
jgi:hypothetical protein